MKVRPTRAAALGLTTVPTLVLGILISGGSPAAAASPCKADKVANPAGHLESIIANLSPAPGGTVDPGGTISFLYTDDKAFAPAGNGVTNPTIAIDGSPITVGVSVGPETSGQAVTYALPGDKGSESTACQNLVSIALPANLPSGTHTIQATAYDGDGDREVVSWTFTVPVTQVPVGPLGGIGLTALAGGGLLLAQRRRRTHRIASSGRSSTS